MLNWPKMADGHLRPVSNGHLGPVSNGLTGILRTSNVTWSQKSTLVYRINPELMCRSIVTDVQICQSHNLLGVNPHQGASGNMVYMLSQ